MNSSNVSTTQLSYRSIKTRAVKFTYGTCKDAVLLVPAEAYSIHDAAVLIRKSYLDYMFSGPAIMSDEVLLSCIGKSNFFEGALGGWETRVDAETFASLKSCAESEIALAVDIVLYRNPNLKGTSEAYAQAAKIENLSVEDHGALVSLARLKTA